MNTRIKISFKNTSVDYKIKAILIYHIDFLTGPQSMA